MESESLQVPEPMWFGTVAWQRLLLIPARVRALAGFVLLVGAELALVVAVSDRASVLAPPKLVPFERWRAGPLTELAPHMADLKLAFLGLLVVMAIGYALLLSGRKAIGGRGAAAGIVAAHIIVFLGPPLILTDVFNYVNYARIGAVHHLNPYVHAPHLADRQDVVYKYTTWRLQATPYGPLFTLGTYSIAKLSVSLAVWALKAATAGASLLCAVLVAGCAKRLGRSPTTCALVVALNPVLLIYGVGGVHNDFFMMAVLLAGLYWTLGGQERAGGAAAVASVAVKASSAVLAPFVVLCARRRGRAALAAVASTVALAGLTVVVFGTRAPGLTDQANSTTRLSLPSDVASVFGFRLTTHCASAHYGCLTTGVALGTTIVFLAALVILLWLAWRGADPLACAGWAGVALVLTLTSVMPWYLLWVLPFAVLSRSRALVAASAILGVLLVIAGQPTSHFLVYGN